MAFEHSRLRRLALIALAFQAAREIEGRTKLQKMLYLANLCGWDALDFKFHYYGPYSDALASELESIRNNGWIVERPIGTRLDRTMYVYYPSRKFERIGTSLVNKVRDLSPRDEKLIHKTRGLVRVLNRFSSDDLEIMATLMFLKTQNPRLSTEEYVKLANELKSQFEEEQISKGTRIFGIMKDFLPQRSMARP